MRRNPVAAGVLAVALGVGGALAAGPKTVRDGADEVLHLDDLANPKRWAPAECTLAPSKQLPPGGRPTLHVHIPVDHHAGEKSYPIGWPRLYLNLKPDEKPWKDFERFEFMVHATMTREKPPKQVMNLQVQCPDKARTYRRNLAAIRLGQWVRVSIRLREVKNVADVARLGLNISESNYRHGEKLDFRFGAFCLARAAEFGLARLDVRSRVLYADRPTLKLELAVVGPPEKVAKGLPLTVRQGPKLVHRQTVTVTRGAQTVRIDLAKAGLTTGSYTLAAFDGDASRGKTASFRVVESPWQEASK